MAVRAAGLRRWLAGLLLAVAVVVLIAGQTVLRDRLGPYTFGLYWLGCVVLTGAAIIIALGDLRAVQERNLEEKRALFQATLDEIAAEARKKSPPPPRQPAPRRR